MQPVRASLFHVKPSRASVQVDKAPAKPNALSEVEAHFLACLIRNPELISDVTDVKAEYFTNSDIAAGFDCLIQLSIDGGKNVEFMTLSATMEASGKDSASIRALESLTVDESKLPAYRKLILKAAKKRATSISASSLSKDPESEEHAADLNRALEIGVEAKALLTSSDVVTGFLETLERRINGEDPPTSTGLADLDRFLAGGFRGGQVIVLAARPGEGKSALAQNIAEHVAGGENGRTVIFMSLEMSPQEIMERRIASASHGMVPLDALREGRITEEQMSEIARLIPAINESKMEFLASASETIEGIVSTIRSRAKRGDLGLVVLDYLQLIESTGKSDNREQQVAKVSRSIKQLALSLQIPILLLSQLNRDGEKTAVKRKPKMSDLRESGSIEQDADIILFIHDDTPEGSKFNSPITEKTIVVAKQRAGGRGDVKVAWIGKECRFANMGFDTAQAQPSKKKAQEMNPVVRTSTENITEIQNITAARKGQVVGIPENTIAEVHESRIRGKAQSKAAAAASSLNRF